jgi:hypothetical protein
LQVRYSEIERKSSNQELRLKTVSFERDQAAKQLAEAYYTTEQMQSENDALRSENVELKLELARLTTDSEENTRQWRQKETGLREKISRREAAVTELREMTQEIQQARLANTTGVKTRKPVQKQQARKEPRSSTRGRVQAVVEKEEPARLRSRSRSQSRHTQSRNVKSYVEEETFDIPLAGSTNDDFDASDEGSFDDVTKTVHKDLNVNAENATQGSNYSSILGHGEMDRLREMLANERARNAELSAGAGNHEHTSHSVASNRSAKSTRVTQGLTGILKNRNSGKQDQDNTSHSNVSHTRRHSETSVKARTGGRQITTEDVTSAFIIPDITLSVAMNGGHPTLSAKAKKVLDTLCHHDGGNCTVCTRVASFENKQTVSIQKPIPVSDRMPVAGPYEDEPTMRPSVTPGLALATVMKGLEDELAHLKIELAQYQAVYNKHDPSLSMRKRKAVKARIDSLLKAIDTKADQIYALYDVLEGQKETGQELSEKEVEVTLMDIGIDVDALKKDKSEQDPEGEDSGEDSELDLPWEGIEDTTGSSSVNGRRRSWVA